VDFVSARQRTGNRLGQGLWLWLERLRWSQANRKRMGPTRKMSGVIELKPELEDGGRRLDWWQNGHSEIHKSGFWIPSTVLIPSHGESESVICEEKTGYLLLYKLDWDLIKKVWQLFPEICIKIPGTVKLFFTAEYISARRQGLTSYTDFRRKGIKSNPGAAYRVSEMIGKFMCWVSSRSRVKAEASVSCCFSFL